MEPEFDCVDAIRHIAKSADRAAELALANLASAANDKDWALIRAALDVASTVLAVRERAWRFVSDWEAARVSGRGASRGVGA